MMRTTGTTQTERPARARAAALAWLRHPASLASIGVLLLNDHVLKAAFGTWWTGKLSDVAGLVFAPALLAVGAALLAPRARPRALAAATIATTGAAFAVVKATAAGAAAASATLSTLAGPSVVRPDLTDLLALPALALAYLAFRASLRHRAASPRPLASRLGTALIVGTATAATLATSSLGVHNPLAVSVIPDGDGLLVKYQEPYQFPNVAVDRTTDGRTWQAVCGTSGSEPCDRTGELADPPITAACVPYDPGVCFRVQPGRIGVDRSDDGGETWRPEWGLTDAERDRLVAFHEVDDPAAQLSSVSLGIIDAPGGFVVVVADGFDGLAVRGSDGTWERRGFLDSDCCGSATPPLDVSVPFATVPGFPAGIAAAAAAWGLAFAITLLAARTRAGVRRRTGVRAALASFVRWVSGSLLVAAGLVVCFAWVTVAARDYPASPDRLHPVDSLMAILVAFTTLFGLGVILLGSIAAPRWRWPLLWRAVVGAGAAAILGTVVALVAGSVWDEWEPVSILTGAVVVVATVPAVVVVRRHARRAMNASVP